MDCQGLDVDPGDYGGHGLPHIVSLLISFTDCLPCLITFVLIVALFSSLFRKA